MNVMVLRVATLAAVAVTLVSRAEGMALLVPAYFSPSSGRWRQLASAAGRVPLVAIANVFNGPGPETAPRPDYVQALQRVREAGGQIVGYVYTRYGDRPIDVVKDDMRQWHERYPIDGFFVDEMSNQAALVPANYYTELWRYSRELNATYRVIGNPGTNTEEVYLRRPAADTVVIFEHHTGYPTFRPAAWTARYPEHRLAHLAYAVATAAEMTNYVDLAMERRAGLIYVTDDSGNNPWDTLPTYWDAEVNRISTINQQAAERIRTRLSLEKGASSLTATGTGATGKYVLEASSPLGDWRAIHTNLTSTGTSVWQILQVPANQFFRIRRE